MVFFSTLGGEGSHLETGSLTLQPSLNWPQFLILLLLSSKVLGSRCVPPWLDSSQLLLGREELERSFYQMPQQHLVCASVSCLQVEKSILVRWQSCLFLLL